jgi:rhamnogalacturonan endolyase
MRIAGSLARKESLLEVRIRVGKIEIISVKMILPLLLSLIFCLSYAQVQILLDGKPASVGVYSFPSQVSTVSLGNDFFQLNFGSVNGNLLLQSGTINGTQIAENLSGSSWYVDSSGGKISQKVNLINVTSINSTFAEIAFVDTQTNPLRFDHHMILKNGTNGVYGFVIMQASQATAINEVRFNSRWDRCLFTHAYNFERGHDSEQPTYAYLYTQYKVQDETWTVDGINNASLPCPDSNAGGLAPGTTYTKYIWAGYHHENPFFGHFSDAGLGIFFTPLGGMTGTTSAANYGVGPDHQDLMIHQDAIILNYMGANHYGLPAFPIPAGFTRFYGPWLTFFVQGPVNNTKAVLDQAASISHANQVQSLYSLPFIDHPLYPIARTNVSGSVALPDARPVAGFYVLLSTESQDNLYDIHLPTYWVQTSISGSFLITGIPADTYSVYIFAGKGSFTGQMRIDNVVVSGSTLDLGTITLSPPVYSDFIFQLGKSDRSGGEFALGFKPRAWLLPGEVPGNTTFTVGTSIESEDWYYAQTQGGVWTVSFTLPQAFPSGTAYLTVAASLTDGFSPVPAINGNVISGAMPTGTDSTLSRQAVRSGFPRLSVLTFDSSLLVSGTNTLTFTRNSAGGNNNNTGMGYDTVILEVNTTAASGKRDMTVAVTMVQPNQWKLTVKNTSDKVLYDIRMSSVSVGNFRESGKCIDVIEPIDASDMRGRNPNDFPTPIVNFLKPMDQVEYLFSSNLPAGVDSVLVAEVYASGGHVTRHAFSTSSTSMENALLC